MSKLLTVALIAVASFGIYATVFGGPDPVAECVKNTDMSHDTCFGLYNR